MNGLTGQLLLAVPRLLDPNFVHTVVLIVRHDAEGALGIVLNRALEPTVKDVIEKALERPCIIEGALRYGGPCEGPLVVLHSHADVGEIEVCSGVYFSSERSSVEWLLDHNTGPTKFFIGYSGWTAGQLEMELESDSWLLIPATTDLIFHTPDERFWETVTAQTRVGRWIDPRHIPKDPRMN